MNVVAVAYGVVTLLRLAEAALEFGPPSLDVIAAPDAVIPADIHHAKANSIAVWGTELVRAEQPVQECLGVRALLRISHAGHPVKGAALLVLALPANFAGARNPNRLIGAVGRLDQIRESLGSGLGRRIALGLTFILGSHVIGWRQCHRVTRDRRRRQPLPGHGSTREWAGPTTGLPNTVARLGYRNTDDYRHGHQTRDEADPGGSSTSTLGSVSGQGTMPLATGKHPPIVS